MRVLYQLSLISILCLISQIAFAQTEGAHGSTATSTGLTGSVPKIQGIGVRLASQAAVGSASAMPINYVEAVVIGIAIITNNNDNDGQPGTFTGGSGSNMAMGG